MDPRGQALTRHATHMLQFKPGTDVALLNAMMNVIVTEALYDRQYVDGFTEGFEALRASVAPFTPEAMSPICGIDPQRIRDVARLYAGAERAMIDSVIGCDTPRPSPSTNDSAISKPPAVTNGSMNDTPVIKC